MSQVQLSPSLNPVIPKALFSGDGFLLPRGLCLNSSLPTIPSFTFPHILQPSTIHTSRTQRYFFLHLELHKSLQFLRTSAPVLTLFTRAVLLNVFSHMYLLPSMQYSYPTSAHHYISSTEHHSHYILWWLSG